MISVDDVIYDAHNTFLKDIRVEFNNELALEETQMDLIIKHDNAFNWSKEDEIRVKNSKVSKRLALAA